MTVDNPVVGFIAMALAIAAILAVGTLIAADIIHLGSHEARPLARESDAPQPAENPVEALEPLGSSLAAGSTLRAHPEIARREGALSAAP
jgi:hypothetical protein